MSRSFWILTTIALSFALPALAQEGANDRTAPQAVGPSAVTDPSKLIYRVSGVRDSGLGANAGVATSFHCTNWSAVNETVAFRVFNFNGTRVANASFTLAPRQTFTASTHATNVFTEDTYLSPGKLIDQGVAAISATTVNILCSAMIVNAASASPNGIALHMVRSNPMNGTTE